MGSNATAFSFGAYAFDYRDEQNLLEIQKRRHLSKQGNAPFFMQKYLGGNFERFGSV